MVLFIRISGLWNLKSKQWIRGRSNWKTILENLPAKNNYRIWFHVASLGEFEQAKPVIENIKNKKKGVEIIVSFFSPSGYNQKHDYQHAVVVFLPADIPGNAEIWMKYVNPDMAVFVKYDLWPGFLKCIIENGIPAVLISAYWTPQQKISSWTIPLTQSLLRKFSKIFIQREEHVAYFTHKGFHNIAIAGDTRIDRSLQLPGEVDLRMPLQMMDMPPFDLIAGSTWREDEKLLIHAIQHLNLRAIIAPHDVSASNIKRLMQELPFKYKLLSELKNSDEEFQVLIVDTMGHLSILYACGDIAYVGGGFSAGIHNLLEPMAHTKPVLFGPRYEKFPEALDVLKSGAGKSVKNKFELIEAIKYFKLERNAEASGVLSKNYLQENAGATEIVTDYLMEVISYGQRK